MPLPLINISLSTAQQLLQGIAMLAAVIVLSSQVLAVGMPAERTWGCPHCLLQKRGAAPHPRAHPSADPHLKATAGSQ